MAPDNYEAGEGMFHLLGEASFGTACLCALRYTADASAYVFTAVHCETGISAFLGSSLVTSAFQQAASVYMRLVPNFLYAPCGTQNYLTLSSNLPNKCRYFFFSSVVEVKREALAAHQRSVFVVCSGRPVLQVIVRHGDI